MPLMPWFPPRLAPYCTTKRLLRTVEEGGADKMLNPAPAQGKFAASFSSPNHQASRPPASFPDARRWTSDLPGDLGNRRFSGPMNLACFVWRPGAGDTLHPEIKWVWLLWNDDPGG